MNIHKTSSSIHTTPTTPEDGAKTPPLPSHRKNKLSPHNSLVYLQSCIDTYLWGKQSRSDNRKFLMDSDSPKTHSIRPAEISIPLPPSIETTTLSDTPPTKSLTDSVKRTFSSLSPQQNETVNELLNFAFDKTVQYCKAYGVGNYPEEIEKRCKYFLNGALGKGFFKKYAGKFEKVSQEYSKGM